MLLQTKRKIIYIYGAVTVPILGSDFTIVETISDSMKTMHSLQTQSEPTFVCTYIKQIKKHNQFDLCDGSRTIASLPNAGGTSVVSETLSFEMLNRMYGAKLQATEMELRYYPLGSKITDYSVSIYGETIGVSVTRAMKFRGTFTDEIGRAHV